MTRGAAFERLGHAALLYTAGMTSSTAGAGPLIRLHDPTAGSTVVIAPERGALVTSFALGGRELLYMDPSTLADLTKNVRGGIPVLFPTPGKLDGDAWRYDDRTGAMKQHGFARNLPWRVLQQSSHSLDLVLTETAQTLQQYPWPFRAELHVELRGARLRIDTRIGNTGSEPLPYALGFHPYFQAANKAGVRIPSGATRAFDNVVKRIVPFAGFDLTQSEVDLHLLDHPGREAALELADGARIIVRGSADIARWVVWTLADREFVCLEPWTAPGNALNTREHLIVLAPGERHLTTVEIEFVHG